MDKKKLYRFKLVHENMWNAEQLLASVHASTDDYINSWLKIQPDKYHDRPDLLEVMSKGEYFGRLGYFSEKDKDTVNMLIEHPRKNPYSVELDKEEFENNHRVIIIISSNLELPE